MSRLDAAFELVRLELARAWEQFENFQTYHQGFAVLREEVDELWDEIKDKDSDPGKIRHEAVQVAAMALRFIIDLDMAANPRGRRTLAKKGE